MWLSRVFDVAQLQLLRSTAIDSTGSSWQDSWSQDVHSRMNHDTIFLDVRQCTLGPLRLPCTNLLSPQYHIWQQAIPRVQI